MSTNILIMYKGLKQAIGKVSMHEHPFWQLEIATRRSIGYTLDGKQGELETGDMLLIPPGWPHEFIYPEHGIGWISFKFERSGEPESQWGGVIRKSLFTDKFAASIKTMVPGTILRPYEKTFVEALLESLFTYVQSEQFANPEQDSSGIAHTITELVHEQSGRPISINELAERLSYTRSHLSKLFKQQTGEHLKAYIDRVRLEKAKELLQYGELTISDITEELGFKDLFSFSRFFKRNTGFSPREYKSRGTGQPYVSDYELNFQNND